MFKMQIFVTALPIRNETSMLVSTRVVKYFHLERVRIEFKEQKLLNFP